uniref:FeS cluster biogenesis domain-containing protein n=1 Tax=Panagrolaimus sp. JU765 TaxID=591449 RepID=A0AC34Q0V9_9BILA
MYLSRILNVSARVVKGRPRMIPTDPTKKPLILTPEAVSRLKQLLSENPTAAAMKLGVEKSGCNGFAYKLTYADKKERFDEEVEQDGVK